MPLDKDGYFNHILGSKSYSGMRYFFKREVLTHFIHDPRYLVSSHNITSAPGTDVSGMQQYVDAIDPNGNHCIMALLSHLCQLDIEAQNIFHSFEVKYASISLEVHRAIIHGEFPLKSDPYNVLLGFIQEINNIVTPRKFFNNDDERKFWQSGDFLPIFHNSRKEFIGFVNSLNNILIDNIRGKYFNKSIPAKDEKGESLGTIRRLRLYLEDNDVNEGDMKEIVDILNSIRKERGEIHGIHIDDFDTDYRLKQELILIQSITALKKLCFNIGVIFKGNNYCPPGRLLRPLRSIFDPINEPEEMCDDDRCRELFG